MQSGPLTRWGLILNSGMLLGGGGHGAFYMSLLFLSRHCGRGKGYGRSRPLRAFTECKTKDRRGHERELQRQLMARSAGRSSNGLTG